MLPTFSYFSPTKHCMLKHEYVLDKSRTPYILFSVQGTHTVLLLSQILNLTVYQGCRPPSRNCPHVVKLIFGLPHHTCQFKPVLYFLRSSLLAKTFTKPPLLQQITRQGSAPHRDITLFFPERDRTQFLPQPLHRQAYESSSESISCTVKNLFSFHLPVVLSTGSSSLACI